MVQLFFVTLRAEKKKHTTMGTNNQNRSTSRQSSANMIYHFRPVTNVEHEAWRVPSYGYIQL